MTINGPLSPNMINAGSGITPSRTDGAPPYYSLGVSMELISAIQAYNAFPLISKWKSIYSSGLLTEGQFIRWELLEKYTWPAFTDAAPYSTQPFNCTRISSTGNAGPPTWRVPFSPSTRFMTALVNKIAELIMGYEPPDYSLDISNTDERDLTKFAQIQGICLAYRGQANDQINSTKNSDVMNTTFTDMDAVMSGSVSAITLSFGKFGGDLLALGNLIDLKYLDYLGYPSFLLRQMLSIGGMLPAVNDALTLTLTGSIVDLMQALDRSTEPLALNLERELYRSFQSITGDDLDSVLELLDVETRGLTNAAELLDPSKIFPNSFSTMKSPVPGGDQPILISKTYQDLAVVTTSNIALENGRMIARFSQVKNIKNVALGDFAKSVSALENSKGLGAVQNLDTSIPQSVENTINNSLATGTGPNNSLTLYDFIGTAAGHVHAKNLLAVVAIFQSMNLTQILYIYDTILKTLTLAAPPTGYTTYYPATYDEFGNLVEAEHWITAPPLVPEYKSYASALDSAIPPVDDLVTLAEDEAESLRNNYSDKVAECNRLWGEMSAQLNRESMNRWMAELKFNFATQKFDDLKSYSRSAGLAMISSLHTLALDTTEGGSAIFFEKVSRTENIGGQSVIASLREGRNRESMLDSGLGVDSQLAPAPATTTRGDFAPANS